MPVRVESQSALGIWSEFLQAATADEMLVRVAVPVGKLDSYLQSPSTKSEGKSRWLADVANGMAYVTYTPNDSTDAKRWLEAIRQPAGAPRRLCVGDASTDGEWGD